ncbi:hypothetical protein CEXT_323501 [Caerostris extrusa]|uniref:Uncharacterized protein n=1 Tax=Caerostris extrusa TaxID=172846 RepID=A0AAV4S889_CAEEX|nr:hypothetical protein CEXT_323501 [Caerostris extrusa]
MSGTIIELVDLCRTLSSIVKMGGFVLLFYKNGVNQAEKFLNVLHQQEMPPQPKITLEKRIREENLEIVSRINDPFCGIACLLQKKVALTSHVILKVSGESYSWVEQVRGNCTKTSMREYGLWHKMDRPMESPDL